MRKISLFTLVFAGLGLLGASGLFAAELTVPSGKTVQEYIEKASPNDTIMINSGVYKENIVLKKPLTIKSGDKKAPATIRAANINEPVLTVMDTSNVTVSDITFTGSNIAGILLLNTNNSVLERNRALENNKGITLDHSTNTTLTENVADLNNTYGISLLSSNNNRLERNTTNRNDNGVFISFSNGNRVINNNSNLNTWNGMTLFSSHNNIVRDNTTMRNTYGIVLSDSNNNELESNTTLPNIFIILPIMLLYVGILSYILQKNILRLVYRG